MSFEHDSRDPKVKKFISEDLPKVAPIYKSPLLDGIYGPGPARLPPKIDTVPSEDKKSEALLRELTDDISKHIVKIANELLDDAANSQTDSIFRKTAPYLALKMVFTAILSKKETVTGQLAKDILHMAGFKPVDKSITGVFEVPTDKNELNRSIMNMLRKLDHDERETAIRLIEGSKPAKPERQDPDPPSAEPTDTIQES